MNTVGFGFVVVTYTLQIPGLFADCLEFIFFSVVSSSPDEQFCVILISMHRAISRVFRGQCRKFRENDCPVAAGEEVRRNNKDDDGKNGFVPPKHNLEDAVTWTTGLVLAYQLTHRGRRALIEDCPPAASLASGTSAGSTSRKTSSTEGPHCPFSITSKVFSQPLFAQPSTALNVAQRKTSTVISSIDTTPFIHDDVQIQDCELPDRLSTTPTSVVEDDDIVFGFEPELVAEAKRNLEIDGTFIDRIPDNPEEFGRKFGADLLSVLGAFEFLQAERNVKIPSSQTPLRNDNTKKTSKRVESDGKLTSTSPPIHAMELLKKGAELGSARAMYNIGVAYDRMNDPQLAVEYYKKAADLGHPLAAYNCAVFALKDGRLTEGYALMKTASDCGVPEAKEFMKPSGNTAKV